MRLVAKRKVEKLDENVVKIILTSTEVSWKKKCAASQRRGDETHQPVTTDAEIYRISTTAESGVLQDLTEMHK
jgi:hypothetical protein